MDGAREAQGIGIDGVDHDRRVSRQAAADAAQVVRGKKWLRRVVEMADAVSAEPPRPSHAAS